jgi:hypothetical protein
LNELIAAPGHRINVNFLVAACDRMARKHHARLSRVDHLLHDNGHAANVETQTVAATISDRPFAETRCPHLPDRLTNALPPTYIQHTFMHAGKRMPGRILSDRRRSHRHGALFKPFLMCRMNGQTYVGWQFHAQNEVPQLRAQLECNFLV